MSSQRPSPIRHPTSDIRQGPSRWSHGLAWALVCGTFPLVFVGGLVTTYGAGMAVPDWPSTFGYWVYYPLRSWIAVQDVFLEHGHRVLGQIVGVLTIALAIVLWRSDPRRFVRWLGLTAVLGVVVQGTLGGLRVIGNDVLLADVHGCVAQLFFALAAALVTLTSRAWHAARPAAYAETSGLRTSPITAPARPGGPAGLSCRQVLGPALKRTTAGMAVLVYVQVVLGAQLRHLLRDASPVWFVVWVWLHLIVAGLAAGGAIGLWLWIRRRFSGMARPRRRAALLAVLLEVQIVLGALTWLTNYGWPEWAADYIWPLNYTVCTGGWQQIVATTSHVAAGSLSLVTAVSLALWAWRPEDAEPRAAPNP